MPLLKLQAHEAHKAVESELSDREKLGSEMADTVKFLQSTQDSVKAEASVVGPAQLETKMTEVKHNIEVRMELILQKIRKQEEKYADMTDMPAGTLFRKLSLMNTFWYRRILLLKGTFTY